METRNALGELIRQARLRRGMTQEALAAQIGVKPNYVSQWETGIRKWPQEHVRAIAEALGLSQVEMAVAAGLIDPPREQPTSAYGDFRLAEIADTWPLLKPEVHVAIHTMFRNLVALPQTRAEHAENPVAAVAR